MTLEKAVRDLAAENAADHAKRLADDVREDVSRLRRRLAEVDVTLRVKGLGQDTGCAVHAYVRCATDSLVHAMDLLGALTLTDADRAEAADAIGRG